MIEMTLSLPTDLAEELLEDDLVAEPIVWRGTDVVSLLTLVADTASAVTAVVVARESIGAVIRRLVRHASGPAEGNSEVKVYVQGRAGMVTIVETNNVAGRTQLEVRIQSVVEEQLDHADAIVSIDKESNHGRP
jgi:hypothetical protein